MIRRATKMTSAALVAVVLLVACAGGRVRQGDEARGEDAVAEAKRFLATYNDDCARLEGALNRAFWKASNSGDEGDFQAYADANLALKTYHSDPGRWAALQRHAQVRDQLDALSARSLDLALLAYKGNQLPQALLEDMVRRGAEIEQAFTNFRPQFEGAARSNNDLLEVLRTEQDGARRRAAWEALKEVGAVVAPKLVALARVRNQAAKSLGFADFWDMQVRLQEHDPAMLVAIFAELEQATDAPFRAMKARLDGEIGARLGVDPATLEPWDYDNPFFQSPPPSAAVDPDVFYQHMPKERIVELAKTFYADIGLEMDDIIAASDYYERPGKDQHAFCITIDRGADVRMLLNIKPTQDWMDTMLHEAGHAVYYKYIDRSLPFNLREAAHILTTEGVAMMFGALAKNSTWLTGYAGADPDAVAKVASALAEQRQREQLIFSRWAMVMFHFERALYADPDQDLNALWTTLVERLQLVHWPKDRSAPDWAAKPHFTIAPVYYHNYLLGELFGAQLRRTLADYALHTGPTSSLAWNGRDDFGAYLKEKVFAPGMRMEWPAFVEAATGKPLGVAAFVAEVQ